MSRIRSKDTKPEIIVRHYLFSKGFRYRIHSVPLPGKPDIVLPKYHSVVFVNGCFWHRCPKCKYSLPASNAEFWKEKFKRNLLRDKRNVKALEKMGWKVNVIWECELKKDPKNTLMALTRKINKLNR